jgi:hypothetical protein
MAQQRRPAPPGPVASSSSSLPVGRTDAPEERAAERAAERVLAGGTADPGAASSGGMLLRLAAGTAARTAPPAVHDVLRSPGTALDGETRGEMERGLGSDFGGVRVHDDARAGESARAVSARAYTVGSHVVFSPGTYAPGTRAGRRVLAHELAHVAQQRAGGAPVLRRDPTPAPAPKVTPSWSHDEIVQAQKTLRAMGLLNGGAPGKLDDATGEALFEAFGGDEWRTLSGADANKRLTDAYKITGKAGQHNLRYAQLFKDGVLDVTLAVGFDEKGHNVQAIADVEKVLTDRGYKEDAAEAEEIYKQAGRTVKATDFGKFFVFRNRIAYVPPAGEKFDTRFIHVVVRLVTSADGSQGGKVADAFQQGMVESDVAFYTGHGRYGAGPDFDPHTVVELLDATGAVTRKIEDYQVLELLMKDNGAKAGRGPWAEFQAELKANKLRVLPSTAGNVRMTPSGTGSSEFGRKLMDWNLDQAGKKPVTGAGGALETGAKANPAREYRVLVFDGCNTTKYVNAIRGTPGYGSTAATDVLGTKDEINWGTEAVALASFLDGVVRQQSAEKIVENMDNGRGVYKGFGIDDNPVIPKQTP